MHAYPDAELQEEQSAAPSVPLGGNKVASSAEATKDKDPVRDTKFSLLLYSFNLNAALRHQLSHEMSLMYSESELFRYENNEGAPTASPVRVLRQHSCVQRKESIVGPGTAMA